MDLLRAVQETYESGAASADYFRGDLPYSVADWLGAPEDLQDRLSSLTVGDAMVREVVAVSGDTPIPEVVRMMRDQRIHRVLVIDGGVLQGIVTTFDLIQLLEQEQPARP